MSEPTNPTDGTRAAPAPTPVPTPPPPGRTGPSWLSRRLVRDPDGMIGGVASGIAQVYGIDVSLVRLAFVLLAFASGLGIALYLVGWIVIPVGDPWPPEPQGG
ncbi:MAG: PspC domain-containing protein [Acidimicrobiales bacterium]